MMQQYYERRQAFCSASSCSWTRILLAVLSLGMVGRVLGYGAKRNPPCNKYGSDIWRDRPDFIRGTHLSLDHNEHRQAILDSFTTKLPIHMVLDPYGDYLVKEMLETGRLVKGVVEELPASAEDLENAARQQSREVALPNWENIGPMNKTVFEKNLNRTLFLGRLLDDGFQQDNQPGSSFQQEQQSTMSDEEAKESLNKALSFAKRYSQKRMQISYLKDVANNLSKENLRYAAKAFGHVLELDPLDEDVAKTMMDMYLFIDDVESAFHLVDHMRKHFGLSLDLENLQRDLSSKMRHRLAKDRGRKLDVKSTKVSQSVPRLTAEQLYYPENVEYLHGNKPFVLTGIIDEETLETMQRKMEAVLEFFSDKSHVSYNPYGVHESIEDGPPQVRTSLVSPTRSEKQKLKIIHLQSGYRNGPLDCWNTAEEKFFQMPTTMLMTLNEDNISSGCQRVWNDAASGLSIGGAFGDREEMRSVEEALPTRLITLGAEHSGLFMHDDAVPLSAWQLQLLGAKTWLFCAPSESDYVGRSHIDGNGWNPSTHPQFALARCTNTTVFPGEIVYYPTKYWHQTLYHVNEEGIGERSTPVNFPWNLSPVNVALGTRVVQPTKVEELKEYLEDACGSKSRNEAFFISDPLFCTRGLARYVDWLRKRYQGTLASEPDHCSHHDQLEVEQEKKRDESYMSLVNKLVNQLEETYSLISKEYQEDKRCDN